METHRMQGRERSVYCDCWIWRWSLLTAYTADESRQETTATAHTSQSTSTTYIQQCQKYLSIYQRC